ncbi:MAG: SDR family NAD(P)-dependent oxidoreductase [Novosphingobium sp.]
MAKFDFFGRTALVTGAASGIGAACARWLAENGCDHLVLVDMDEAGLAALELPCRTSAFIGDVADEALWDRVEAAVSRMDHAVLSAGIASGTPLVRQDFGEWRRMQAVNLDGVFLGLRCALRLMLKGEGNRSAVLLGSAAGVKPMPMTSAYGTTKAAIAHLARVAAAEHVSDGIRVNAIAPGRVETPIWTKSGYFESLVEKHGSKEAAMAAIAAEVSVMGRTAQAEDMAGQIGFLLSDEAWTITGEVLGSDCGYR